MAKKEYKRGVHCPKCGDRFEDGRGLNGHLRFKHGMEMEDVQKILNEEKMNKKTVSTFERISKLCDELREVRRKKDEVEQVELYRDRLFSTDKTAKKMKNLLQKEEEKIAAKIDELQAETEPEKAEKEENEYDWSII